MAIFVGFAKLSPEATAELLKQGPVAREKQLRQWAESTGIKVLGYYFAEGGEWDVVTIAEGNEEQLGAGGLANLLATQATGIWAQSKQIRLHTADEMQAAMASAATWRPTSS
jgi:uncharacterized protein with GYD domain